MPITASDVLDFAAAGRIPAPGDNVAIAVRTLPAGTRILIRQLVFEFSHTVLEGHRFAVFRIPKGAPLLSWGLPFGLALRDIEPGEYICNEKILRVLRERNIDFPLPSSPNFLDHRLAFELTEASFSPGRQVVASTPPRTFDGFPRSPKRGVGTRNYIVIIGTNSRTGAFAQSVCRRFPEVQASFPHVDGVVPVAHTEGGGSGKPNNFELTLRTLAGFMVNPNVGAVLCVDYGNELLSNAALQRFLAEHRYPREGLLHRFISIGSGNYETALESATRNVSDWLPQVNAFRREDVSASHLRLGLQCGGSDAFSGVSANPLVGILSRETVAQGGSANLAETDELIGAESYVLANVREFNTARSFLEKVKRFQEWAARHGHTAEGNPSGGNMYRGLYNIAIKSIGAARKKDPATRLDYVIDFAERMSTPGFYFMDSPGNDLESIAGQVAAGCNLILFATGNGSITNFPFVPTIKIMTTTRRFDLVRNEMDFNAGRYQDGEALEDLGREAFDHMLGMASGKKTAGERAGHSQVQLWRDWRNNAAPIAEPELAQIPASTRHIDAAAKIAAIDFRPHIALILPTSLCASQIALGIADKLNKRRSPFSRAVALPHTEGCGNSGGESERLFMRTMAAYLAHPFVKRAVLLEHGCEKTHNDAFRSVLREHGLCESDYAFRSVQLDGGIDRVTDKSLAWFTEGKPEKPSAPGNSLFALGLHGRDLPESLLTAFQVITSAFVGSRAAVVRTFGRGIDLQYGACIREPGLYRMQTPTEDDLEMITGLGAAGVQLILAFTRNETSGNPLIPTLRIGYTANADLILSPDNPAEQIVDALIRLMLEIRSGNRVVSADHRGDLGFQITRGDEGISL